MRKRDDTLHLCYYEGCRRAHEVLHAVHNAFHLGGRAELSSATPRRATCFIILYCKWETDSRRHGKAVVIHDDNYKVVASYWLQRDDHLRARDLPWLLRGRHFRHPHQLSRALW